MSYITDKSLSKLASEKNVQPLAHHFGVSVDAATDMLRQVKVSAYVEEMARRNHVANNDEELNAIIELGQMVEAKTAKAATTRQNNKIANYKYAGEHLARELGEDAPEAYAYQQAHVTDSAHKVAQYAVDPNVVVHLLALNDAYQLSQ